LDLDVMIGLVFKVDKFSEERLEIFEVFEGFERL
jgi:hypothetical protein